MSDLALSKTPALADGNDDVVATLTLRTASGAPVAKTAFTATLSGEGTTVVPSGPKTDEKGVATVTMRATVAEEKTLTVSAGGATVQKKVLFVPGAVANLVFVTAPTTTRVGQVITPAVALRAEDVSGNVVRSADVTVSVRLVRSMGGVVMNGGARPITDGGVVFDMLTIDKAQNGYALRAEASNGGAVESALFDVTP
jgi:hypothetical protein